MSLIYVLTENNFKFQEIEEILINYGLHCKKIASELELKDVNKDYFILREETSLNRLGASIQSDQLKNLDRIIHSSCLHVIKVENDDRKVKTFKSNVDGYIDLNRRSGDASNKSIYNWDDVFVELETLKSYQEMKESTLKFSARTKVVSQFVEELITFEDKVDLNHNPFNQEGVLSFSGNINTLIDENKYLSIHKNNELLSGLVSHIKREGLFTRSAINKSQRNYWFPSLNAGLPLVPKSDEIHEITFMFHDLMHHVMPDLILSGEESPEIREAYIIHRMLSEAFTIVLADMLFVDELVESGIDYDWSKRKIYPIFKEFKKGGVTKHRLKELLWANVQFALLGDKEPLIKLSNASVVQEYDEKYSKFFIEDYRWTLNNYENMMASKKAIKDWYDEINEFIPNTRKVDYFVKELKNNKLETYKDKVKVLFDESWSLLLSNSKDITVLENKKMNKNAFINYMIGQSFVFFKYDLGKESQSFFNLIKNELKQLKNLESGDAERIRGFFDLYVERLNKRNIISETEMNHFKDIMPLFKTFFVFYEQELKYSSVKEVISSLIDKKKVA